MRISLAAILALFICSFCSTKPGHYEYATVNLGDSINSKMVQPSTDPLPSIIIDGFLKGKIKLYKFDVKRIERRAPLADSLKPQMWDEGAEYYPDDRVAYGGKFYVALSDQYGRSKPPPEGLWEEVQIPGELLSAHTIFPSLQDTLPKRAFIDNQRRPDFFVWQPNYDYYNGDLVFYEGQAYLAISDNHGKKPATEGNFWVRMASPLRGLPEFNILRILSYRNGQQRIPQTIAFMDESGGNFAFHAFYDDVINYLSSIGQPALYVCSNGYLAPGNWVINENSKDDLLREIRQGVLTKGLADSVKVLDPVSWKRFLEADNNSEWSVRNAKRDLAISREIWDTVGIQKIKIATLSSNLIERQLSNEPILLRTYSEFLENSLRTAIGDSTQMDSLVHRENSIQSSKRTESYIFLERTGLRPGAEMNTRQLLPAWKLIATAVAQDKIRLRIPFRSFYDMDHKWTGIKIELFPNAVFTLDESFSIGSRAFAEPFDMVPPPGFAYFNVVYKKWQASNGNPSRQEPFEVQFVYPSGSNGWRYALRWTELKPILSANSTPEVKALLQSIENGTLDYADTELMYGLIEDK